MFGSEGILARIRGRRKAPDADDTEEETSPQDGPDAGASALGVVTIAGRVYAVGLEWQRLEERRRARAETAAARKSAGASVYGIYNVRRSGGHQLALGWSEQGHARGQNSLAAHLASSVQGRDMLGAFRLPNGHYYVWGVRDGRVIPATGDVVYLDEDSARQAFLRKATLEDWDGAFAPSAWGMPNTHEMRIEDVLVGVPPTRLSDTTSIRGMVIALAGVLTAAIGGYWMLGDGGETQDEVREKYFQAENTVSEEKERAPYLYEGEPRGADVAAACLDRIWRVPVAAYPGWAPVQVVCDAEGLDVHLRNQYGRMAWVETWVRQSGFGEATLTSGRNKVIVRYNHTADIGHYPRERVPDLADLAAVRKRVETRASEEFVRAEVDSDGGNESTRVLHVALRELPAPQPYIDWIVRSRGTTVETIAYAPDTGLWEVEGKIYANVAVR